MNSYWIDSINEFPKTDTLRQKLEADVCIIGAGITGLSTGYYLAKQGMKVVIVEKDMIGEKTSGHTTAKITSQHHLIYDYLFQSFGKEFAKGYFSSNQKAITNIKEIIALEKIDCDFEEQANYVYTTEQDDVAKILNEVKAIHSIARRRGCFIYNRMWLAFSNCRWNQIRPSSTISSTKIYERTGKSNSKVWWTNLY